MTIERLTILVVLASAANLACVVLLALATYYNVRNYRVLRRMQQRGSVPSAGRAPERVRVPPQTRPTERYDSASVPDRGQVEWTGPVVPYVPADRVKSQTPSESVREG